jgi:hypothetical protein
MTAPFSELDEARRLLEERNRKLAEAEKKRQERDFISRVDAAVRAEQERAIGDLAFRPPGMAPVAPSAGRLRQQQEARIVTDDRAVIAKIEAQLAPENKRLDEFVRTNNIDGLTRHQLAREGLPPMSAELRAPYRSPAKELNKQVRGRSERDPWRKEIEHQADLDDRAQGRVRPDDRSREFEEALAAKRQRDLERELRLQQERERGRKL